MIYNPSMFIGEVVTGGTNGAPLSVSSTGKLAVGITTTSVNSTVDTTTTSTAATHVLINSMTITPAAGTYMVWFNTTLDSNTNNANIFVALYSNSTIITGTEMGATPQTQGGLTPSLNSKIPISTHAVSVTVNGSQAIEARWRISVAGTATAHTRMLSILRTA